MAVQEEEHYIGALEAPPPPPKQGLIVEQKNPFLQARQQATAAAAAAAAEEADSKKQVFSQFWSKSQRNLMAVDAASMEHRAAAPSEDSTAASTQQIALQATLAAATAISRGRAASSSSTSPTPTGGLDFNDEGGSASPTSGGAPPTGARRGSSPPSPTGAKRSSSSSSSGSSRGSRSSRSSSSSSYRPSPSTMDKRLAGRVRLYAAVQAGTSLVSIGLSITALGASWYTAHPPITPLPPNCLLAYGLTSYGWVTVPPERVEECPGGVKADFPPFNTVLNIEAVDRLHVTQAAAVAFCFGLLCSAGAVGAGVGLAWRAGLAQEGTPLAQRWVVSSMAAFAAALCSTLLSSLGAILANARFEALVNAGFPVSGFGVGRTCGDTAVFVSFVAFCMAALVKGKLRKAARAKKAAIDEAVTEALEAGVTISEGDTDLNVNTPVVELTLLGGVLNPMCKCC
jgi:hypothetical protein